MKIIKLSEAQQYYCHVVKSHCLGSVCMAWREWCQNMIDGSVIIHTDKGYCSYLSKENQDA